MTDAPKPRSLLAALIAVIALVAVALPSSASGSFDRHFSVISKDVRGHETATGFAFRILLLNPQNPRNIVGHGQVHCRGERGEKAKCRGLLHFDGSIGGFGDLLVKGNFGRGDNTLLVADGNGDFGGEVAGKMTIAPLPGRGTDLLRFDLTR